MPSAPPARQAKDGATSEAGKETTSPDERSPYDRVLWNLHHDRQWVKEVTLGRRVGFYRFHGELGQGNFSTVKLGYHQLTRDKVAVKVIEKTKLDAKTQKMLSREISNMESAAHPHIIRLFEMIETVSRYYLVLEYAPGGELFNKITTSGSLDEALSASIFAQILSAVVYLHSLSIVHRDIKAENVFFSASNQVKLGDFGFSTRVNDLLQQLSTFCGSPPYAAPELYKDESYVGPPVDVWAMGVLLFFILTADMPFKANTVAGLKRYILAGSFIVPSHVSEEARGLIRGLLVLSPKDRLTTAQIADHAWLGSTAKPVEPMEAHVLAPSSPSLGEEPAGLETEALAVMERWGVPPKTLAEAAPLGARSSLIATYRILMHRLRQRRARGASESNGTLEGEKGDPGSPQMPQSPPDSLASSPKKSKFRFMRCGAAKPSHSSVKSKVCSVL